MRVTGVTIFTALLLLSAVPASADTVVSQVALFAGRNVYAPSVINDEGIYKMWYGGWQTEADFPNDKIYYRTSSDNTNWSAPMTVLQPSQVHPNAQHVNDPSVTKHFDATNGLYQYTMFYTVCMNPCNPSDNQIWSSTSADGVNWENHQMLLAGPPGPAEPSIIIDPEPDGTFWKVYYVDRLEPTKVKVARVDGNRNATSVQIVYTFPGETQSISGPEVRAFNGKWHLFFNVFFADRVDIYKVESTSNTTWPSTFEIVIQNSGPLFCGTLTPSILPAGGAQYDLYYGLTPRPASGCDLTQQQSVHRWRMED